MKKVEKNTKDEQLQKTPVLSSTKDNYISKSEGWVITFMDNGIEKVHTAYFSITKRSCIKSFLDDYKGDTWVYLKRILKCKCVRGSFTIVAYNRPQL